MKAIILAAGRGSRMGDGTANTPKCLMLLNGRTLLEICVENLIKAGFKLSDIGIVTGYKHESIKVEGVSYFHNAEWESTNMFYSLTMAREWLLGEPCIVCYSDIIFSPQVINRLMLNDNDIGITYYVGFWELWKKRFENPLDDLETFKLAKGRLVEIGKKPRCKEDMDGQYMGILKFTPNGWNEIEAAIKLPMSKTISKLDMTSLLQHLIEAGVYVVAIECEEMWFEFDCLNDIMLYERMYMQSE